MHRIAVLTASALVGLAPIAVAGAASAGTYTSGHVRCTIVGTPHADRLVGTSHNDVICGLGGNDTIYGQGGNDIVDAGTGNDSVHGGTGNDRLYAGTGNDLVWGDSGNDAVSALTGNDAVSGGTGNDVVSAYSGDDRVSGGDGRDRISGGDGNDTLAGNDDDDALYGGAGNDDMTGDSGSDVLNGGTGTNWCDVASDDQQVECAVDHDVPEVADMVVGTPVVDVTSASAVVPIRVRLTDDTGVHHLRIDTYRQDGSPVGVLANGPRVSGTARDGWWSVSMRVPRFVEGGTWDFAVNVTDRIGREGARTFEDALQVVDRTPDTHSPQVLSAYVDPGSVDVTHGAVTTYVKIHATDDASGIPWLFVCPKLHTAQGWRDVGQGGCWGSDARESGTSLDGVWSIPIEIPKGAASGDWDFGIQVEDRAHPREQTYWVGGAEAAYERANDVADDRPSVPGEPAILHVHGTDSDAHVPELLSVTATPATVDASHGARTVTVDVAARDVEGLAAIRVGVRSLDDSLSLDTTYNGELVSGTDQDGVWRFVVTVPGGEPPGQYYVTTWLEDSVHQVGWGPQGHTWDGYLTSYASGQATADGYLTVQ